MVALTATSALDDAALAAMRAEAEADRSPFINPAVFRDAQSLLPGIDHAWLARVTGREVRSWQRLAPAELTLAVAAAKADAAYLQALGVQRRAAQQAASRQRAGEAAAAAQAERDAWEALRGRLPVPVQVCHNWTARHLDGYEQGADHIVVMVDLHAGRLHRTARSPLCWTPSRAHELRHVTPNVGDDGRIPDCKACLRRAEKLATTDRRADRV